MYQNVGVEKRIPMKAFGPSPQGEDSRKIFNHRNGRLVHEAMWRDLRTKVNAIYVHIMLIANESGVYRGTPSTTLMQKIALNDHQLGGLRILQKEFGFKVIVDTGLGLGLGCQNERRPWKLAENAVNRDYKFIRRLQNNGVNVDQITVDGPFLRLIEGSEKAFSCADQNAGFSTRDTAEIVSRYLGKLYRKVNENQPHTTKMNILLNLPNLEMANLHGFFDVNFVEVITEFAKRKEYPEITEFVLDYPYSNVKSARRLFENKLLFLEMLIDEHMTRGRKPNISVITNTGASFSPPKNHRNMSFNEYTNVGNVTGYNHGNEISLALT